MILKGSIIFLLSLGISTSYGFRNEKCHYQINGIENCKRTGPTGPPWPNTLQALNVTTLTNPDCRARHIEENAYFIFDQKICTYNLVGQGVCFGDSGGSIVVGDSAIAIVSWGVDDCGDGGPDVYIRISYVYNWILEAINS